MTLIKTLIEIPERVHQGDFVLKLSEGLQHADQTLRDYVVTPQLAAAFDNALAFIKSAVETRSSKAAYLHGSFGSGKSHFMAVLSLLLNGHTQARSITELADVVARHNAWTQGKKFLVVPYHMIGADDMESAILGGYAEHVRRVHSDAPVPGFYLAEGLFRDAQRLREQLGDEAFFDKLNAGRSAGGWGALGSGWDAASFDSAMLEPPTADERMRLVGDLIDTYFEAYRTMAATKGEAFVSLDDGLSIMSKHANALGYDAVVLFLDELILWLASRAADVAFVSSEGTKLVKLVEATHADRPVPLVSFVARQRDLRELVGDNLAAGSVQTQFSDSLRYWEARFHKITLEDRNLPTIAEKRILRPVSPDAKAAIDSAFSELLKLRPEVLETLLTDAADREMFRKLYPFSPALVETLVAVSSVLQRERTALKLMLQLLVDRRDELALGQIIGVGDLWDVIAEGDEPFSEGMRVHFENAKRLWQQKLQPLLERHHGTSWQEVRSGTADPAKALALRNDGRILKTLLLAALVPEVKPLRVLTAQRLAALNHGTFKSPIPGREAQDLLRKCHAWAAEIGEIKITADANPIISMQVTGVDIEPIVEAARVHDNPGNRKRKIREMLFAELGLPDSTELFTTYSFNWRGTRREAEILYENVRALSDDRLKTEGRNWTVVIDFPFDEAQFGPADDRARLAQYAGAPTRTLAWIPVFLSHKAQRELGRLVVLDYILVGDRFNEYAGHLSLTDRLQAKALATNQRDQLKARLRQCIEAAYGISEEPRDGVDVTIDRTEQFVSLEPTFSPQRPVGANLREALEKLLDQALAHQFPAHPVFDADIRPASIKKVWAEIERAAAEQDQRVLITDRGTRQLVRAIANPLKLGEMGETHLHLHEHWKTHFLQCHAKAPGPITVSWLRNWLDEPRAMGLPTEAQNLVILTFAAQTNRSFRLRGGPAQPTIDSLADELELVEQALPDREQWKEALRRMSALFGKPLPETLNAGNLARLEEALGERVKALNASLESLGASLPRKLEAYVADPSQAPRRKTVASGMALLASLLGASGSEVVRVLATARLETSEAALALTMSRARELDETVRAIQDELFDALRSLSDDRKETAKQIIDAVGEALRSDEHAVALKPKLEELQRRAIHLLAEVSPPPTHSDPPPETPTPGVRIVGRGKKENLDRAAARSILAGLERELEGDQAKRLSISWTITRQGDSQ